MSASTSLASNLDMGPRAAYAVTTLSSAESQMFAKIIWWVSRIGSGLISLFFVWMGISLCRAAFFLENPHHFILTFFASNLIILISLVAVVAVLVRIIARLRQPPDTRAAEIKDHWH